MSIYRYLCICLVLIFINKIYSEQNDSSEDVISIAKVIRDFNNYEPKYLVLKEGDKIRVLSKDDDIWFGELNKQIGYFPKDFVQEIEQTNSNMNHNEEKTISSTSFNEETIQNELNSTINSSSVNSGYQTDDGTTIESTNDKVELGNQIEKVKYQSEEDEIILREIEEQMKYEKQRQEEEIHLKQDEEELKIKNEKEERAEIEEKSLNQEQLRLQKEELDIAKEKIEAEKREREEQERLQTEEEAKLAKEREEEEAKLAKEREEEAKLAKEREEEEKRKREEQERLQTEEEAKLAKEREEEEAKLAKEREEEEKRKREEQERLKIEEEAKLAKEREEADKEIEDEILRIQKLKEVEERIQENEILNYQPETTQSSFVIEASSALPSKNVNYDYSTVNEYSNELNETHVFKINENLNKVCADLSGFKAVLQNIETLYEPIFLIMPESLQSALLEPTDFLGLSIISCSIIVCTLISFLFSIFFIVRKTDNTKIYKQINLNEIILQLELKMKNLKFERDTFEAKLSEYDKDVGDKASTCLLLSSKLEKLECEFESNNEKLNKISTKCANLEAKNKELSDAKLQLECDIDFFKLEKDKNDKLIKELKENETAKVELNLYHELEAKIENLRSEITVREQQLEDYKKDSLNYEKEINDLKEKLDLRDKSIILLQNCVQTSQQQQQQKPLPTINETNDDDKKDLNSKKTSKMLDDIMDVAQLQLKIQTLEQQLQTYDVDLKVTNTTKEKLESEIEVTRKEYSEMKLKCAESQSKIKELELKLKLVDELRKKDLELNVKACSELDAQLKKKSSDAEKSSHLLEQIKLKQERIQELETQYGRLERQSTQERQTFEKQAHENWLNARKFEKEAKEAKQEAKLWKDKYSEIEKFKETTLLRPVPMNIGGKMPYLISNENISGLNQTIPDSDSASPPATKSFNESINTNGDRPASAQSNGGYPSGAHLQVQMQQQGISPTPMMYKNMQFPQAPRLPFPPQMNPFMTRMQFGNDGRGTTSPNPELMAQFMNQYRYPVPPMMPLPFMNSPGSFNNSLRQSSGTPLNTSMTQLTSNDQAAFNMNGNYAASAQDTNQQQQQNGANNPQYDTNISFNV